MSEPNKEFIYDLLRYIAEEELDEEIRWTTDLKFYVICNDMFWWACGDAEDITPENLDDFKKAIEDAKIALEHAEGITQYEYLEYGPKLFCARQRGMRPQGAYYKYIPELLWPLFNECGDEREVDFGNPYSTPSVSGEEPEYKYMPGVPIPPKSEGFRLPKFLKKLFK